MTPPCKKNGIDCPDRHYCCWSECDRYKRYKEEHNRERELFLEDRKIDYTSTASYETRLSKINNNLRFKGRLNRKGK